jgi:transposase
VSLYQAPPPDTHVICVDEMGPVAAKTYLAPRRSDKRPIVQADYGRRGSLWTFGAFEPRTGLAVTYCGDRRDTANFLLLLDEVVRVWPEGEVIIILDNLSIHKTLDVRLWALAHEQVSFLFQPTYSPWLNLIEPWWKTLRSLALKGRRFENTPDIARAIAEGTGYWNDRRHPYRWRKAAKLNLLAG